MEGPGVFKRPGDVPLEGNAHTKYCKLLGNFKNNYFHMGGDVYVNPFQSREEIESFIHRRDEHQKFKEMRIKEKLLNVQVTESLDILQKFIAQSANNKRIPLLLSSKKLYTDLVALTTALNVNMP